MNLPSLNRGVPDIKRICSLCGIDRTPLEGGIYPVNDRRGKCLGLFGECCWHFVQKAVDESPRAYRSYPDNLQSNEAVRQHLLKRAKELLTSAQQSVK